MAKSLSILFVTSEIYPFSQVGGLSDISYSLPLALRDMGHDARVMLPKYGCISERRNRIHEINRLRDIPIPLGSKNEPATVKSSSVFNPRNKVQAYITTNQRYFDSKKGLYTEPRSGKDYTDNDERFIFFNRTVIETCLILGWFPDIIHCNDWQCALIPAYIKTMFPGKFKKTKIVFTINDFHKQGCFPDKNSFKTGLPADIQKQLLYKDDICFLRSGIIFSDYITTGSPSYRNEIIQDKKYGGGINTLLAKRDENFTGILNGIDTWTWNPKNDILIKRNLDDNIREFKLENRKALFQKLRAINHESSPLIAMVMPLEEQRGLRLFSEAFDSLMEKDVQIVLFGDGSPEARNLARKLSKRQPHKFILKIGYDETLVHLLHASSDIFLQPSLFEPDGLQLMYALTYGSVPVVRACGAAADLISEYNTKSGNGFVFKNFKTEDLMKSVGKALDLFAKKAQWEQLSMRCASETHSWEKSVKQYDEIYRTIVKD